MPKVKPMSRRTLLRGALYGAAVSIALPPLEAMMGVGNRALAADQIFPKRFVLFFWGNGTLPEQWIPGGMENPSLGADWTPSDQLAPLAHLREDITILSGYEVKAQNLSAHFSGPCGLLSGFPAKLEGEDKSFTTPSLDQLIANELGGETPYRSIEAAVQPGASGLSFVGTDLKNPPISDPAQLFQTLFGEEFVAPGENQAPDPKLGVRRSILDAVMEDMNRVMKEVGAADKIRLDQHLSTVRDIELRLQRMEEDPPNYEACSRPDKSVTPPDLDGRPDMQGRARVTSDLLTMAMACDLTRVSSLYHSDPLCDVLWPEMTAGHHQLTHDEVGEQPQVNQIIIQTMEDLAYLIEAMKAVPEGDGTLLDNTVLLATSDCSYGKTHQIDEFPIVLAGRGGGALKTGFHHRTESRANASMVSLGVMRAMGMNQASFGAEDAYTESSLSEIEA